MMNLSIILLSLVFLLPSCKDSKSSSVPILTTFDGISSFYKEIDGVNPRQIGAKYYGIEPIGNYTKFQVVLTENGTETILGTHKIDTSAENIGASLHIQHSHNDWVWFFRYRERGGFKGIAGEDIPKEWHVNHATESRFSGLKKPTELLDTFYLLEDGNPFEKLPMGAQNFPSDTSEEIRNFTKGKSYLKAISIVLMK